MPKKRKINNTQVIGNLIAGGIISHQIASNNLPGRMVTRQQKKALASYLTLQVAALLIFGLLLSFISFGAFTTENNIIFLFLSIAILLITLFLTKKFIDFGKRKMNKSFDLSKIEIDEIKTMNEFDFEMLITQMYQNIGYKVEHVGRTGDHGIDIKIWNGESLEVVQCKRISDKATESTVRDLHGAMHNMNASGAILCSTGGFTDPAKLYAQRNKIKLLDALDVLETIHTKQNGR